MKKPNPAIALIVVAMCIAACALVLAFTLFFAQAIAAKQLRDQHKLEQQLEEPTLTVRP